MINEKVTTVFSEIADMLEILGENVFRIRAYRRAAEVVRNLGEDLERLHKENDAAIEKIPGIGKDLHNKIIELIETGECEMHERLQKKLSPGILEILRVRGIGPKKVKLFYEQLGITTLEQLQNAAESGALATLPGMGEKSEESILEALENRLFSKERIPYEQALKEAEAYIAYMNKCKGLKKIAYAGSLRRKRETIGDVDLLVAGDDSAALSEHFTSYPKVSKVLGSGDTKSSVLIGENVQVDLRVVEPESFGAALLYFTGSKQFNIDMRTLALKKGLKINEYGIYRGEERLAGDTEKSMFDALEMDFVEPEERE